MDENFRQRRKFYGKFSQSENLIPEIFKENFREKFSPIGENFIFHFDPYGSKWGKFSPKAKILWKIFADAKILGIFALSRKN